MLKARSMQCLVDCRGQCWHQDHSQRQRGAPEIFDALNSLVEPKPVALEFLTVVVAEICV